MLHFQLEDNEDRTSRGRSQSSLESVDESSRLSGVSTNSEAERYEVFFHYSIGVTYFLFQPELPATAKVIMDLVPNVYDSTKLRLTVRCCSVFFLHIVAILILELPFHMIFPLRISCKFRSEGTGNTCVAEAHQWYF